MSGKRGMGCTLYIYLFALFWLFSSYVVEHAIADEGSLSLSGLLQVRYDGRYPSHGVDDDHKLRQIADVCIKENKWGHSRFTLSGDIIEDIDSNDDDDQNDRTRTVHDTWDSSSHGYLYVCQAEIYELDYLSYARLGRQYVNHELTTTHLDGFNSLFNFYLFDTAIKPFVYAGTPVRLYEDSHFSDAEEFGGGTHIHLGRSTKLTLEHQIIKEKPEIVGSYEETGTTRYKQSAFAIRQSLFYKGYGYASLYMLDNTAKHINTRFSFAFDRIGLDIDASYFYQFDEIDETPPTSAYTGLTGEIKPYHTATVDIMKGLKEDVYLSTGIDWRALDSGEDETEFNHSYYNPYIALIIENILMRGISLSLQYDFWKVNDHNNEDTITSIGGEIGYRRPQAINITAGTFYSLYKYDYFNDANEKTDVYTVYSDVRYYIQPGLYFDGRYELDIHDIHEHRFIATLGLKL